MIAGTDNNGFCVLSQYTGPLVCTKDPLNPYNISTVICLFYKEVEEKLNGLIQDGIINRHSKTSNSGVPDSRDVLSTSALEPLVRN